MLGRNPYAVPRQQINWWGPGAAAARGPSEIPDRQKSPIPLPLENPLEIVKSEPGEERQPIRRMCPSAAVAWEITKKPETKEGLTVIIIVVIEVSKKGDI